MKPTALPETASHVNGRSKLAMRRFAYLLCNAILLGQVCSAQTAENTSVCPARVEPSEFHLASSKQVLVIEFADLECPACAQANPFISSAVSKYSLTWQRHDFPLEKHSWAFQAAVNARFFDSVSGGMGNTYRDRIYSLQEYIPSISDLERVTVQSAHDKHVQLTSEKERLVEYADAVKSDYALGLTLGVHETPTIWLLKTNASKHGYTCVQVDSPRNIVRNIQSELQK